MGSSRVRSWPVLLTRRPSLFCALRLGVLGSRGEHRVLLLLRYLPARCQSSARGCLLDDERRMKASHLILWHYFICLERSRCAIVVGFSAAFDMIRH